MTIPVWHTFLKLIDWPECFFLCPRVFCSSSCVKLPLQVRPLYELVKEVECAGLKKLNMKRAMEEYLSTEHPCRCRPCNNNGQPRLIGSECHCVCRLGTSGQACQVGAVVGEPPGKPRLIIFIWLDLTTIYFEKEIKEMSRQKVVVSNPNPNPVAKKHQMRKWMQNNSWGEMAKKVWLGFSVSGVIHGSWSCWSSWGSCTGGQRTRSRNCNNPAPSRGGGQCVGPQVEHKQCEDADLQHLQ